MYLIIFRDGKKKIMKDLTEGATFLCDEGHIDIVDVGNSDDIEKYDIKEYHDGKWNSVEIGVSNS